MQRKLVIAAVFVSTMILSTELYAQLPSSSRTNTGMFGSRSLGSSSISGPPQIGAPGAPGSGQNLGAASFQAARGPGDFIGRSGRDVQNFFDVINAGAEASVNAFTNLRDNDLGRVAQPGQGDRGSQSGVVFRPRLRAAMIARPVRSSSFSTQMQERMQTLLGPRAVTLAEVVYLENATIVLRGFAATNYDRLVAANLAALEPGVVRVQNELQVGPPPAVEDTSTGLQPQP